MVSLGQQGESWDSSRAGAEFLEEQRDRTRQAYLEWAGGTAGEQEGPSGRLGRGSCVHVCSSLASPGLLCPELSRALQAGQAPRATEAGLASAFRTERGVPSLVLAMLFSPLPMSPN